MGDISRSVYEEGIEFGFHSMLLRGKSMGSAVIPPINQTKPSIIRVRGDKALNILRHQDNKA